MPKAAKVLAALAGFSALQRAENSSMTSSANTSIASLARFSALQRAENSSISRNDPAGGVDVRFSALQRAENSSMVD